MAKVVGSILPYFILKALFLCIAFEQTRIEDLLKEMDELKTAVESIDGGTMAEHYRSMRDELIKVSREVVSSLSW